MDVSIIIVTYNSSGVIGDCLDSLRRQKFDGDCEVIVVDNASSDGTPSLVAERFPWVQLIAGDENLGYSKGVNIGIRHATGRFFLILNPDTVVKESSVQKLVDFAVKQPDAGIVSPKLVFHDGNTQLSCRRFYTFKVLMMRRTPLGKLFPNSKSVREHLMLDFDHNESREVDWVLGAAMLVKREAVESVGLMDERFFLYFEDVDWCYRMKQNGLKVYYYADAVLTHGYARESAQSVLNRSFVSHLVSLFRYYEKWNNLLYWVKRYREVAKVGLFLFLDVLAFNAAFLSAYYLRVILKDIFVNPIFEIGAYQRFVVFENLLFVFTFAAVGLYKIRRETRPVDELFTIGRAIIFASVLLMTSTYLSQIRTYSRMVVAFVVPFAIMYSWWLRLGVRRLHRRLLAHQVDMKRACLVGPKDEARQLELDLIADDTLGFDIVGIVDTEGRNDGILTGALGSVDDLERIVDRHRVQEVIVLPGAVSDERLAEFVAMGRRRVLDITALTDYAGLVTHQAQVSDLSGRPTISYARDTRYALDRLLKRSIDILGGTLALVVSLPCYLIYSLYALSRGAKPFGFSDRAGFRGAPLTTPVAGGETARGPSDLVNLPLFWLVVIGKMSLVGPYPIPTTLANRLDRSARFRFDARPGVTGYWRAGASNRADLSELLAQDAKYLRNWSLIEDAKILFVTLGAILRGRKRYLEITGTDNDAETSKADVAS